MANFALTLALLLVSGLTPQLHAQANRLNLFIWSEYIDPAVVADFEKTFACRVTVDLYEDDAGMLAKLQAGGAALYDLVVPPDYSVSVLLKLGLLAPLRHENVPNLQHIDPQFRNPPYDPQNRHSVPYQWGTVGLYFRTPKTKSPPDSWATLFDPQQQLGPFVLIDSPRDLIAAALRYLERDLNSSKPEDLKAVRDLLLESKRRCVGFDGSVGGRNKVLSRTAQAAIVYSGEAARGIAEDPETAYIVPKEGSILWVDNLAVLAQAPHRDLAEKFINFITEPTNSARISNFTRFASPNLAARPYLRPADLQNPVIYPSPQVMARVQFLNTLGTQSRLYDEVWSYVKGR